MLGAAAFAACSWGECSACPDRTGRPGDHVRDGDTIEMEELAVAIRLERLHALELHQGDAEAASAFMRTFVEGKCVSYEQSGERTRGRRVGRCFLDGVDFDARLIQADLARDCARFSGGRYAAEETVRGKSFSLPGYCMLR